MNATALLLLVNGKGREDIVRLLMNAGADVSKVSRDGTTPTTIARQYGHAAVVALLEGA